MPIGILFFYFGDGIMREIKFFANEDQLDQLRYALVDRVFELEGLLSKGDCEGILQSARIDTLQLIHALKFDMNRQTVTAIDPDFSG